LISTLGECLTPPLRRQIETTFACQMRDNYGCSEVQVIVFECERGTLHVNADWVILEQVDAAYQPVPAGQVSHTVLLTNLANHIQPITYNALGRWLEQQRFRIVGPSRDVLLEDYDPAEPETCMMEIQFPVEPINVAELDFLMSLQS
jgi:hypothetical protein